MKIKNTAAVLLAGLLLLTGCSNTEQNSSGSVSSDPSSKPSYESSTLISDPASSAVTASEEASEKTDSEPVSSSEADQPTIGGEFSELKELSTKKQGWGPGVQKDENNRPIGSITFQEKYGKYGADFIAPADQKTVYLTFDEGYEYKYTPVILDTLKEKQVSAVFFVTMDYVKRNPELVQRMIDEGHIVGNHSTQHKSFPELTLEEAREDITTLHDYVKQNFNYEMTLFRFPMGEFSEQMLCLLQELHYRSVFWSFAYADWDVNNQMGYDTAFQKVTSNLHPGAIYLLHAVSKDNSDILGAVIDQFREEGYTFSKYDLC